MVSEKEKEPEVLKLLSPKPAKEQIEIFPEFYAVLEEIRTKLAHMETQQTMIITLLNQKINLDTLEAEVMDLLKKRMQKGK